MTKVLSCGIVFLDTVEEKVLMVHPTNQVDYWDFPKGRQEIGETPLETAIREVEEETGILVTSDELIDCGFHKYNKHKNLHLFLCVDKKFDLSKLECTSMVVKPTHQYPEVDKFEMFSIVDAIDLMCPSMKKVFVYEIEQKLYKYF